MFVANEMHLLSLEVDMAPWNRGKDPELDQPITIIAFPE